MSKDIIIRRDSDGVQTLLEVTKIRTPDADGWSTDWVEEDVTDKTAAVRITQNGSYSADELGVYGITAVRVDVDFSQPVTVGDITYQIYLDVKGKPHISVRRTPT